MEILNETMRQIGAIYLDVFGSDLLRYVMGAGGVYLLLNILLSRKLVAQKIRDKSVTMAQICREVIASMRTVAIFAATGTSIALGANASVMHIYSDVSSFGWPYLALSTIGLIVLHDAWFYWTHRLMHYPPLFKRLHRLHHKSHQPTPFTSYSFDTGEAIINAIYLPLILLVAPMHPLALLVFVSHMMIRNALAHCGYEVFPARKDGRPLIGWMTTVTHHDMHHAHAGKNLGFYFTWWDRLMKTEHPNYIEQYKRVGQPLGFGTIRNIVLILALLLGMGVVGASASELSGSYASPGMQTIVQFQPCPSQPQLRCGVVEWMWDPAKTPHAKLGDIIVYDLKFIDGKWHGQLKSPENGTNFKGSLTQLGNGKLHLRGCAGPFCGDEIWHSKNALQKVLSHAP